MRSPTLALVVVLALAAAATRAQPVVNLVTNGGFERPAYPPGSYHIKMKIPGWTATECGMEIQNGIFSPQWGDQYVELDSTCPSAISQTLETTEGGSYKLCFYYSPRPGVADNRIRVLWDGVQVKWLSKDGTGNPDTLWKRHCLSPLVAAGSQTVLEFQDASAPDTVGGLLDHVSVVGLAP